MVVVESDNHEKNRQFVERLGARLMAETNLFTDVFYKGDLKMLGSKALLFVPEADLKELQKTLASYGPFLKEFTQATNLSSLLGMVNRMFIRARPEQGETHALTNAIPALERIVRQAADSLRRTGMPPSPGVSALFDPGGEAEQQVYITFDHGRLYLVTAQAPREDLNHAAVQRLRELVDEVRLEVPGVNAGLTGEPVLEVDEMNQSQQDTTVASVVSLVVCALIFIYGYQETGRPIKATICLVVGLGYTMAFTTLVIGHLNILTITFVPILIGLAIDFGVHLISRYEEELRHGLSEQEALTIGLVNTGRGIFTGAVTTAGAFLAMGFTSFKGIQEMGIICGGGLLVCLIPMMTLLPVMLLRGKQNVIDHVQGDLMERRERIENIWLSRPRTVLVIGILLCLGAAWQSRHVYFDYNLLHMQSEGLPAVEYEQELVNSATKSVLYAAIIARDLEHARQLESRVTNLTAVASVDSITGFLSEEQAGKLKIVDEIKRDLASIVFTPPDPSSVKMDELSVQIFSLRGLLGKALQFIGDEDPGLTEKLQGLRAALLDLRQQINAGGREERTRSAYRLGLYQKALFNDIRETFDALRNQDTRAPLRIEDLPEVLRNRFVGVTGKHLLMVYPKKDVWQRENQAEFIGQLRQIDEDVTGTPVQLYEYTGLLKSSYEEAARYSLIAIALIVLVHFRSITPVFLSLLPVGIGFLWMTGFMGSFDIPLNPANIMTLPLVIGIGVTNGLHILNRYAEEQHPSILARSTGKAVIVSGLTSMAGFGSLMLAQHRGIASLGYVMSIGLATCMIAGLTLVPALLNLWFGIPEESKNRPSTDNGPALGREEPR